ncbi:major facilitator transporter [Lactococcus fujiensis JCM 16395]|uniref:Major facilitator transporter n=2 Tax=Lactococcus fujiensis TaxID=610251 RepID=A0A2A5RJE9_9LACT|nr:major facilitator transporter [Lactococcus fujiensis JCM 16395]
MIVGTAWMIDALDVALLSFIMPLLKNDWHLNPTQLGLLGSVTSVGMIVGAFLCGRLSDKFGRKRVMLWTLFIFSLSNLALSLAPDVNWFMFIRFITGIGLGGELPVAAALLADHYRGKEREKILILGDSFWAYGWILASLMAFLIIPYFGWRITAALVSIFSVYAFILRKHLPDDPKVGSPKENALKILFSRTYRSPLITLSILWFITMLTYYGIFLWLPSILVIKGFSIVNSLGFTLMISIAQLPGYYLAAFLMDKMNRKILLSIYLMGTIISCLFFGFGNNIELILVAGAFMSFFDLGAWGILIALTPTQFPIEIRGSGMGTAQAVGRIGATIGPFLVGWMIGIGFGISTVLILFVVLLFIAIVVLFFGFNLRNYE